MSQVDKSAVHDFSTGETVTEAMLDQNTEVLRVANNDNDARIKILENAQAGSMTGIRSGTAFPTNPVPKAGDKFYRTDQEKEYVYSQAGTWDVVMKQNDADTAYVHDQSGTGKIFQSGKTGTLTIPAGQSYGFDYAFPTPYSAGITPTVVPGLNGSISSNKDLTVNVANTTNTGFRIEVYNRGSVDEYSFVNWIAIG
jgi:hypothetical protein